MVVNNEVLIARTTVTNATGKSIFVGRKYAQLFHGEYLSPGRTIVRFPIHNLEYKRLITQFQRDFPEVTLKYGANTIEEY